MGTLSPPDRVEGKPANNSKLPPTSGKAISMLMYGVPIKGKTTVEPAEGAAQTLNKFQADYFNFAEWVDESTVFKMPTTVKKGKMVVNEAKEGTALTLSHLEKAVSSIKAYKGMVISEPLFEAPSPIPKFTITMFKSLSPHTKLLMYNYTKQLRLAGYNNAVSKTCEKFGLPTQSLPYLNALLDVIGNGNGGEPKSELPECKPLPWRTYPHLDPYEKDCVLFEVSEMIAGGQPTDPSDLKAFVAIPCHIVNPTSCTVDNHLWKAALALKQSNLPYKAAPSHLARCFYCNAPPTEWIDRLPVCKACADYEVPCSNRSTGMHYTTRRNTIVGKYCSAECVRHSYKHIHNEEDTVVEFCNALGIDYTLVLPCEAAEFYLLYLMQLDHPKVKPLFDAKTEMLADQLSKYMFSAIGGELRLYHPTHSDKMGDNPEARMEAGLTACRAIISDEDAEYFMDFIGMGCDAARYDMWENWHRLLHRFDEVTLIKLADTIFNDCIWTHTSSCGGKSWGRIAHTLLLYKTGELSPVAFIDTAWGLRHNGSLQFDKVWIVHHLQEILDANRDDELAILYKHAGKEIQEWLRKTKAIKLPKSTK